MSPELLDRQDDIRLGAVLLVVLILTLSFGVVPTLRRVRLLRPLFGLAPQRPEAAPKAQAAAAPLHPASGVNGAEAAA